MKKNQRHELTQAEWDLLVAIRAATLTSKLQGGIIFQGFGNVGQRLASLGIVQFGHLHWVGMGRGTITPRFVRLTSLGKRVMSMTLRENDPDIVAPPRRCVR